MWVWQSCKFTISTHVQIDGKDEWYEYFFLYLEYYIWQMTTCYYNLRKVIPFWAFGIRHIEHWTLNKCIYYYIEHLGVVLTVGMNSDLQHFKQQPHSNCNSGLKSHNTTIFPGNAKNVNQLNNNKKYQLTRSTVKHFKNVSINSVLAVLDVRCCIRILLHLN